MDEFHFCLSNELFPSPFRMPMTQQQAAAYVIIDYFYDILRLTAEIEDCLSAKVSPFAWPLGIPRFEGAELSFYE